MRVRYVGPFAIEPLPDAPEHGYLDPGDEIEVPDEFGARLLEQPANWVQVLAKPAAKTGKRDSAPVVPERAEQESSE